ELDEGEISTVTDAEGYYEFNELDAGTYVIAQELQDGWEQTYPSSPSTHTVELEQGEDLEDIDFGNFSPEPGLPLTIIEDDGTAAFGKHSEDNTYWIVNNDTQEELQLQNKKGKTYTDSTNSSWDGVAVETDGEGGYRFLLDGANSKEGKGNVWYTNDQGVINGKSGWLSGNDILPIELEFNVDLNNDGEIGGEPGLKIIEDDGTAAFAKNSEDNTYWIVNNGTQEELQLQNSKGKAYTDGTNSNWDGVAVEADGEGGYRFLLDGENKKEGKGNVWYTDDQGVIKGNSGWLSGNDLLPIELEFNVDLNDDGEIGGELEITIIEDDGTAAFAKDALNDSYWIVNNGTQEKLQLQNSKGKTYTDSKNSSWDGLAVEVDGEGGYRFLLDGANSKEGKANVWYTDDQGVINGNSGWLSGHNLLPIELEFNVDLNDDGEIGGESEMKIVEDGGTVAFAKDSLDNTYWIVNNGTQEELQLQNSKGKTYTDSKNSNWDGVAVEADGEGGYRFLLDGENNRESQGYVWFTDDQGVINGKSGWLSGNDLLPIELEFNVDLNDDGEIGGEPEITIVEDDGTAAFAKDSVNGNYWIVNNDTQEQLQLQNKKGKGYNDSKNSNWDGVAVEADQEGGYRFLLDGANSKESQGNVWYTDEQGVINGKSGWLSGDNLLPIESEFNVDLNDDGIIGSSQNTEENELLNVDETLVSLGSGDGILF
ncbi:MAG: hypothetical protein F6K54_08670, partial [Okeania sp. SIO3B5]|uniref:hypothetical protein n=1 Tax=Okeania sp. SIO3B5 TaxID=2607811 RepID=UPI0013FF3C28